MLFRVCITGSNLKATLNWESGKISLSGCRVNWDPNNKEKAAGRRIKGKSIPSQKNYLCEGPNSLARSVGELKRRHVWLENGGQGMQGQRSINFKIILQSSFYYSHLIPKEIEVKRNLTSCSEKGRTDFSLWCLWF